MNESIQINKLETLEVTTSTPVTASVIWLHGLGADGHDFEPIVPELHLPETLGVRFIFPHAPVRPVTINSGYAMRAWFDIISLGFDAKLDTQGLYESVVVINDLIAAEHERGISYERIILAGFSQGGTVALWAGLTHPKRLAGILGLSTFLPPTSDLQAKLMNADKTTPIMQTHGIQDDVLPLMLGQMSKTMLETLGFPVSWHTYNMGHSVCPDEIRDVSLWIQDILSQ